MRLLFLDIDGVMNSVGWWKRRPPVPEGLSDDPKHSRDRWIRRNLDPDAIARLEIVRRATDCQVVLSSSWRAMVPLPIMTQYLREIGGFGGMLIGATPEILIGITVPSSLVVDRPPGLWVRGQEIQSWLDALPAGVVTSYVVLDDDEVPSHDGHFIQTDVEVGLTDDDAQRAIDILRGDRRG